MVSYGVLCGPIVATLGQCWPILSYAVVSGLIVHLHSMLIMASGSDGWGA